MNSYVKLVYFVCSITCSIDVLGVQQVRRLLPCLFYQSESVQTQCTVDVGTHTIASKFHVHNEDVWYVESLTGGGTFYGVFDGHGSLSHIFAHRIAQKLYEAVNVALIQQSTLSQELFTYIWTEVDKAVCKDWAGDSLRYIPGCTALVVIIHKGKVWLLNTGDSRALVMKKDNTFVLSEPHTVLRQKSFDKLFLQDSGHIIGIFHNCPNKKKFIHLGCVTTSTVCDARGENKQPHTFVTQADVLKHFNLDDVAAHKVLGRMGAYVAMSHSFGDVCKEKNKKITFSAEPDCMCFDQNKIAWIVLGSDGLWDFCNYSSIIQAVHTMVKSNYTKSVIAQTLCEKALQHWQHKDDVTVVALFFKEK